jgi:tRNA threonylcarbamoyladenosine biosynthesis protein TsaB
LSEKITALALILNIDTATESGSVCLARDGHPWEARGSERQKDHASQVMPFVNEVLEQCGVGPAEIEAVAVSGGPGSYTGLRVATSTAKGLCYAWNVPLLAIGSLKILTYGMQHAIADRPAGSLWCPLIDARRMDVFTALYDDELQPLIKPGVETLSEAFLEAFKHRPVHFFGTGADKARFLAQPGRSWQFSTFSSRAEYLAPLAERAFQAGQFQDLAYFEPFYLKAFFQPGNPGSA